MPQLIKLNEELLRINSEKNTIEYSTTNGRTWSIRCNNQAAGRFVDLLFYKEELYACTSKGIYYSANQGRVWYRRCSAGVVGDFFNLQDNGNELLATTSRGIYSSTTGGRTWYKRS